MALYYVNSLNAELSLYQGRGTWPVAQLAANELGIHDMSGNVWEWCEDLASDPSRRLRGGSWLNNGPFSSVTYRSDDPHHRHRLPRRSQRGRLKIIGRIFPCGEVDAPLESVGFRGDAWKGEGGGLRIFRFQAGRVDEFF